MPLEEGQQIEFVSGRLGLDLQLAIAQANFVGASGGAAGGKIVHLTMVGAAGPMALPSDLVQIFADTIAGLTRTSPDTPGAVVAHRSAS